MIGSLFFKAFVGFVVITGILSLALLIISSTTIKNLYIDTLMRKTENLGNMLRSDIVAYLEEEKTSSSSSKISAPTRTKESRSYDRTAR